MFRAAKLSKRSFIEEAVRKLMGNLLVDKKVLLESEGKLIKWCYIQELEKVQHDEGLRAGNTLDSAQNECQECYIASLSSSVTKVLI